MLIGLSGKAGSGKSTVADFLVRNHCFETVSLADPLKRFVREVVGFSRDQLWGASKLRNEVEPRTGLCARDPLLAIGDTVRSLYADAFVDCAARQAVALQQVINGGGVVIVDVRYKNEVSYIRRAGGKVWRIVRPGAGLRGPAAEHASENDLGDGDCDRVINNQDGPLEELAALVAAALK